MSKKFKVIFVVLVLVEVILLWGVFFEDSNVQILNPKGPIARAQRDLGFTVIFLMLIVAIPMTVSTFFIAYKYRAGNKKAKYEPEVDVSRFQMLSWWLMPLAIVLILAVIIWKDTHTLDPHKPLESNVEPIKIQVVALQWKWLFIYPEQNIATVNFFQFPIDTPINFELTADNSPMNSFWIPQLGGQIYAMTGMRTKHHLMAGQIGDYSGSAAEINGLGFSGMKFIARASSKDNFDVWVRQIQESGNAFDIGKYKKLAFPSVDNPIVLYSLVKMDLYNEIVMKYTHKEGKQMIHNSK